jgi:electron transport complex protein RnfC
MRQAKTFPRGGVYPPDTSERSRSEPVTNAAVPSRAVVSMSQHAGMPAECLVRPGDLVREGMMIGRAKGPRSAHIHSPIPGRVVEITEAAGLGGEPCPAVAIELGGEFDRSGHSSAEREWRELSRFDLLGKIQSAGIVDLGGSFLPAHLALASQPGETVALLAANGVEPDPSLSCVSVLLREKPREVVKGIAVARKLLAPSRTVLAVGEADRHLVPAFERAVDEAQEQIEITVVSARYPQGDPQQLAATLLGGDRTDGGAGGGRGREEAGRPAVRPVVVLAAATFFAVYEAVALDKPLIERLVTVSGSIVRRPRNLKARIGTRIDELFDECGGLTGPAGAIVLGGLMTGRAVDSPDAPLTKAVSGVIALSAREARVPRERPCIGCGRCIDACPWGLVPARLYKLVAHDRIAIALEEGLAECSECGCCAFACPSRIPLAHGLGQGKTKEARA